MAGGDVSRPRGKLATALIGEVWPSISETGLEQLATDQAGKQQSYNGLGEQLNNDMLHQPQLIRGHAGDSRLGLLTAMRDHAYAGAGSAHSPPMIALA